MNSNQPLVSIIIPVYKVEKYLPECIESCLNQTYRNIEIIAVNDGSPDNSGEIIDCYAKENSNIIHIRKANGGTAAARENGIEASKGDYILFLDGDDFMHKDAIEKCITKALETDADFIYSDFYHYYNADEIEKVITNRNKTITNGLDFLEAKIQTFIWMKLIKREHVLNLKIQNSNVSEDYFSMLQILPRCKKTVYVQEPLYYYRQHSESIMNRDISFIVKNWLYHSLDRAKLIETLPLTQKITDDIMFDNVLMIFRCMKHISKNEYVSHEKEIKKLINITYKNFPYTRLRRFSNIKLSLFLISAKIYPNLLRKFLK